LCECDKKYSDKDPKRRNVNKEPKESNVDKHPKGKNANKNKKIKVVNKNAKKNLKISSTTTTTTTKAMTIVTIGISTEMRTETSALVNETPAVTIESNAVQAPTLEMLKCYFNCRSGSKLSID
jgi:2-methylcitrate dehydratase PrpD